MCLLSCTLASDEPGMANQSNQHALNKNCKYNKHIHPQLSQPVWKLKPVIKTS